MFERGAVLIELNGDKMIQVAKRGVTPPEFAILRMVHKGAVVLDYLEDNKLKASDNRLFDILKERYRKYASSLDNLFPGLVKSMPKTFAEVKAVPNREHPHDDAQFTYEGQKNPTSKELDDEEKVEIVENSAIDASSESVGEEELFSSSKDGENEGDDKGSKDEPGTSVI